MTTVLIWPTLTHIYVKEVRRIHNIENPTEIAELRSDMPVLYRSRKLFVFQGSHMSDFSFLHRFIRFSASIFYLLKISKKEQHLTSAGNTCYPLSAKPSDIFIKPIPALVTYDILYLSRI